MRIHCLDKQVGQDGVSRIGWVDAVKRKYPAQEISGQLLAANRISFLAYVRMFPLKNYLVKGLKGKPPI